MTSFFRRRIHLGIPALLLILFAVLSLMSDGYFGGADNISHYLISHFAFRYPPLFLNSWGRPLYTLVSAPFAQFGLQGAKLLNIILGVWTAWFAFRIARMLKIEPAMAAFAFVCFTPLYFAMMPTALTEILFSFIVILSIFLFLKGRYVASAIVISLLPFARAEGYVMLPLFLIALLWVRQARAIPFLATGIILFSIAGGFYYRDLLWLVNRFPYPVNYTHPIYNKAGSLWHFLGLRSFVIGLPLEILFIAGMGAMLRDLLSRDHAIRKNARMLAILVFTPFVVYFAFHSFLFWKALGGSMGLERVMAAVLPLAALISLKGFSDLAALLRKSGILSGSFMVFVIGAVLVTPFITYKTPCPLSPEEETIRRATAWLQASPYAHRLIFYTDNNVPYYLKADPYRKNPAECSLFGDSKFLDTIPCGSVLVWDAHFGANESKIPMDSLLGKRHQKVINYFRPAVPWITFGGGWYDCYITVAMGAGEVADNRAIRDSLQEALDAASCYKTLYLNTFENPGDAWDQSYLTADTVHRGKKAYRMDSRTEYSPGICHPVSTLPPESDNQELRVSLYVNIPVIGHDKNTLLVISFEHRNKSYSYTAVKLNDRKEGAGRWNRVTIGTTVPKFLSPDDQVKVYIWNPGKQLFYIDDLRVYLTK